MLNRSGRRLRGFGTAFFHGLGYKSQELRVTPKSKHVTGTYIAKHRIWSLQPQFGFYVILKILIDEIADVGDIFEMFANFPRRLRVESNGTLCRTGHSSNVPHSETCEVANLLIVKCIALPETQTIAPGNGVKKVRVCHGLLPSHGPINYHSGQVYTRLRPDIIRLSSTSALRARARH